MKYKLVFLFIFVFVEYFCSAQLVRKVDYDAAIALHVGGHADVVMPGSAFEKMGFGTVFGLKMTFPFNRRWFLGMEVDHDQFKTEGRIGFRSPDQGSGEVPGDVKTKIEINSIKIPVYLKYLLDSRRNNLLLGGYFSWRYKENKIELPEEIFPGKPEFQKWDAGFVVGYEKGLGKVINMMFRIDASVRNLVKNSDGFSKKIFPVQASLIFSFDVLRIGDCGCY